MAKKPIGGLSHLENLKFVWTGPNGDQPAIVIANWDGSSVGPIASTDGAVADIPTSGPDAIASGVTTYTYFDFAQQGYRYGSIQHFITATTLTLEMTNIPSPSGEQISSVASATDGSGATITDSALIASPHDYIKDGELDTLIVVINSDTTTPANVGQQRVVKSYDGTTGAMTLDSALPGPSTSGVTQYILRDSESEFGRRVSDTDSSNWSDVTNILCNEISATVSGTWFFDTEIIAVRMRVKRVTTGTPNSCKLLIARGR